MRNGSRFGMVYPSHGHKPTQRKLTEYGHPAHRGFAEVIGATDIVVPTRRLWGPCQITVARDLMSAAAATFPERDVYILENDAVLYAAYFLHRRRPDATIIHLAASDRVIARVFVHRTSDSVLQNYTRLSNGRVDNALLRRLLTRYCDGVIAVSGFVRDRIRSFVSPSFPVRIASPYIQPDAYTSLESIEPDLSSKVAVTVGENRAHKGVDLLVDAWPRVRERHPDAELRIIGRGFPSEYADRIGVTLRGFVESVDSDLSDASLYVHPAYAEPFGVSVIEAMRAGVPALVTETTGAASVVARVDDSMIVHPSSEALAAAVSRYFDLEFNQRSALSDASRVETDQFSAEAKTADFRQQFFKLLDDIE